MDKLIIAIRFIQFWAVMTLFGSSLFPLYALTRTPGHEQPLRRMNSFCRVVGLPLCLTTLLSAIVWLGCEAVDMSGDPNGYLKAETVTTVLENTQFGHIWFVRLGLLVGLTLFLAAKAFFRERTVYIAILVISFLVLVSLAGVGHGAMGTGSDVWLHLGNQALHLLSVAIWIGSFPPLLFIIYLTRRGSISAEATKRIVTKFSTMGVTAVLAILASGSVNSFFLVGSVTALLHTGYGQVLSLKILLFLSMVALALYNRVVLVPRLNQAGDDYAIDRLYRSVVVEQLVGILVIICVSILGTLAPAFDMGRMAN